MNRGTLPTPATPLPTTQTTQTGRPVPPGHRDHRSRPGTIAQQHPQHLPHPQRNNPPPLPLPPLHCHPQNQAPHILSLSTTCCHSHRLGRPARHSRPAHPAQRATLPSLQQDERQAHRGTADPSAAPASFILTTVPSGWACKPQPRHGGTCVTPRRKVRIQVQVHPGVQRCTTRQLETGRASVSLWCASPGSGHYAGRVP
mmetsp:Transcript_26040/g.56829  ORF Transcript_26040/g.56829 Transcript_26040/m.56829 type:complete len:200 (+) Transcript_26040:859-1458(+)